MVLRKMNSTFKSLIFNKDSIWIQRWFHIPTKKVTGFEVSILSGNIDDTIERLRRAADWLEREKEEIVGPNG